MAAAIRYALHSFTEGKCLNLKKIMGITVIICLTSALSAIVLLLAVAVAVNFYRKRYSSTQYNKIRKIEVEKHNKSPKFQFVVPTHIPKTITLHDCLDDDDTNCGKIDADMIDPELYLPTGRKFSTAAFGRLCFNVRYVKETEQLIVDLIRGEQIQPRRGSTASSVTPYVKLCLLPEKKKKLQTKTRRKTSNPLFNEQFVFPCSFAELKERSLRFTVCDFDRFSRQCSVGKITYKLDEHYEQILKEEGSDEIWRELEIDDSGQCEVENSNLGEILFSLQYLPAAKRLAISIMKGKNFGLEGDSKTPVVHVKIEMILAGKASHVKKTTKKNSNEPVFNESFHFDLPDHSIERTSFVLSVINNKAIIGKIFVGPPMYVTGTGLNHWNSMLNSPRNAVAMWHAL